jgi:hypothetical protein
VLQRSFGSCSYPPTLHHFVTRISLFHAEGFYAQENIQEAFDLHQESLKKIPKDKNIIVKIPAISQVVQLISDNIFAF